MSGHPRPEDARAARIRARLLAWYDRHARDLPWRRDRDPYRVWLSEVLLQQTTVPHARPYFETFLRRWPSVRALAAADDAEVMAAWAGLGYYARARNLLACARVVAGDHDGRFPDAEDLLRRLPGIGAYTAAAVAAIAFGRPANAIDANVERVIARLFAIATPLPAGKSEIAAAAASLLAPERAGDWPQALMDLGALVCAPAAPACDRCPLAEDCRGRASGAPQAFPVKAPRRGRPARFGAAFVLWSGEDVALEVRPARGLLGGMLGLPTTAWEEDAAPAGPPAPVDALAKGPWRPVGAVEHGFTHFTLTLEVCVAQARRRSEAFTWVARADAPARLPTVFRKALAKAEAA